MFKQILVVCLALLFACPLFGANPFERALLLNGQQQYFEVPDSTCPDLASSNPLTVEIRFKSDSSYAFNLLNKWRYYPPAEEDGYFGDFKGEGWLIDFHRTTHKQQRKISLHYRDPLDGFYSAGLMRVLKATISPDGSRTTHTSTNGGPEYVFDEWRHVALVFDGHNLLYYVNGVKITSWNDTGRSNKDVAGCPLQIGGFASAVDATLDLSAYLHGAIDELRIWKVARTVEEINATINDTLSAAVYTSPESGLIGYYRFEALEDLGVGHDGLANDVRDLSPSANHGNAWNGAQVSEVATGLAANREIPVTYKLQQNFPNPFNPSTTIRFDLAEAGPVDIRVYNVKGQMVATITDTRMAAGSHQINWAAPNLPSGVYLCRIQANDFEQIIKMVLQK